jgi:hypothetical protein
VLWWCGCSICACACGFDLAPSSQLRAPRVANLGENSARFVRAGGGGTADVIYLLGGVVEVFVWSMLRTKVLLVCFYQHCWRLRMSIFFLKALLEHCCSLSPTTLAVVLRLLSMSSSASVVLVVPPVTGEVPFCVCLRLCMFHCIGLPYCT